MAANVEYDFENYFELDEEKVRRIHSILKERTKLSNEGKIKFQITRIDNFIYTTETIEDVIKETNDSTSKINNLIIHYNTDELIVIIQFNDKSGASINVTGDDRDNVFLLSSELRDYIKKEVANHIKWLDVATKKIMIISMVMFLIYVTYLFSTIAQYSSEQIQEIINNGSESEKLNFLINKDYVGSSFIAKFTFVMATMIFVFILQLVPMGKISNYFFPKNTFLFGKQIQLITKRKKTNSNIFWVVIVGGLISLILAFIGPKLFS
ncbi:hypothetical protein ABRP58_03290 [Pectobacterium aroidearum]|uniref:hypothetical protein n=1 Tax=Pectobacterium aroidearum TaxID=1201031 RepID=UPI0032EB5841